MEQKITPNDLRLGNWLYYTEKTKFSMQVCALGKDWVELNIEDSDGDPFDINGDDIFPIPFSVELLSELSKNIICDGYIISIKSDYSLEFLVNRKKEDSIILITSVSCRKHVIAKSIRYVHELQNLYHAFTGKELKIRREWI